MTEETPRSQRLSSAGSEKGLLCFSIHKEQLYANVPPSLSKLQGKRLVRLRQLTLAQARSLKQAGYRK